MLWVHEASLVQQYHHITAQRSRSGRLNMALQLHFLFLQLQGLVAYMQLPASAHSGAGGRALLSRLHYCLPGWGAAEQRRRRAERGEWQEAARARGLAWDERGTDSSEFEEPRGAYH